MSRPCHVYDYEGEHLASFASWDAAHEWAHMQAALGGVATPVEVEDRHHGLARRVWAERCERVHADVISAGHGDRSPLDRASACTSGLALAFTPPLSRMPM